MQAKLTHTFALCAVAAALLGCSEEARPVPVPTPPVAVRAGLVMASGWVAGSAWPAETGVALNSAFVADGSRLQGNLSVITHSSGPYLTGSSAAAIGVNSELVGTLVADGLELRNGSRITGNARYNAIPVDNGTITGTRTVGVALPLPITVPSFPNFSPGTTDVDVAGSTTQVLVSGAYGVVTVRAGGAARKTYLRLAGGDYFVRSLNLNQHARVECAAACRIFVKERLAPGANSYVGPAGLSGLVIDAVQVIVEGANGGAGAPNSTPLAAEIGQNAELKAFIFVPNGTLKLKSDSLSAGKFVARDLQMGPGAVAINGTGMIMPANGWVMGNEWPTDGVVALNSLHFASGTVVNSDAAVILQASGPVLADSSEASIGQNARVVGDVRADSLFLRAGSVVQGDASYNTVGGTGTVTGTRTTTLALPLPIIVPSLPPFAAGTTLVDVPASADWTLAAGAYGDVILRVGTVSNKTVLTLTGGTYDLRNLDLRGDGVLECSAPCEVRVKERVAPGTRVAFGPRVGSGLTASDVVLIVEGSNGAGGGPSTSPPAAVFGQTNSIEALVFAPNGTLDVRSGSTAKGRFVARDVALSSNVVVHDAVIILSHPADQHVLERESATFVVVAVGENLTYRWQKNGVDVPGATSNTFTIASAALADQGSYRVIVSDAQESVTSRSAVLNVQRVPPLITDDPDAVTVDEGQTAVFSCSALGSDLGYRWQKEGSDLSDGGAYSGSGTSTLNVADAGLEEEGAYRCVVTNPAGSATSAAATLTVVLAAPVFTQEPQSVTVNEHATATFHCAATGTAVSYSWTKDGAPLAGESGQALSISDAGLDDEAAYRCVARNRDNTVTSSAATLTVVLAAPVFTQEPQSVTVNEHATATFHCAATGTDVTYSWTKGGVEIADETAQELSIADAGLDDEAAYRCVARNRDNTVTSDPATLTVVLSAPVFTQEPANVTVNEHATATFHCAATGTGVSYSWTKDGVEIADETAQELSIGDAGLDDEAAYRCVARNRDNTVTSSAATLTVVLAAPVFTQEPASVTVNEHATATFHCAATGTNVTYSWTKDGVEIAGETAQELSIADAGLDDEAAYRCVASNRDHTVTSDPATLTVVLAAPVFTQEPESVTVNEHATATFHCAATGTNVTYAWTKDGVEIADETAQELSIGDAGLDDEAAYRCVARNRDNTVTSDPATLTVVLAAPVFTQEPASVTVNEHATATFHCAATGTGVSYSWTKDSVEIADETAQELSIADAGLDDEAAYRCVARNRDNTVTSDPATLTVVLSAPVFTQEPASVTVNEHATATFHCAATGTNVTYSWTKDGVEIAGETDQTLSIADAGLDDEAAYRCVARNRDHTVTSDPAPLTVVLAAPVFTQEPQSVTVNEHAIATFHCAATGTNVTYAWTKDGAEIAEETAQELSIADAGLDDEAAYRCVARNRDNTVTSDPATLTVVLSAPVFTQEPASVTVNEHATATFHCAATGTNVTYAWTKDGVEIADETDQTLSISDAALDDEAAYRCVARNRDNTVTSDPATLTVVLSAPVFTQEPASVTVNEHATATFHCAATGTGVSYSWTKGSVEIADETAQTLSIADVGLADEAAYRCVARNRDNTVTSDPATLTVVLSAPVFTQEPASVTVNEHATATFHCAATGTGVSYSWTKDGVEIADETAQELSIGDAGLDDEAAYRCVARNRDNTVTSSAATLTVVLAAPVFTQEPASVTVNEHATATFHCAATGTNVTYSWTKDGVEIAGETAQELSIADAGLDDEAAYRCVASNRDHTVTSDPAPLTVVLAAPVFTQEPQSVTVNEHAIATFHCAATGTNVTYAWTKDGAEIAEETAQELSIADAGLDDEAAYRCVARNRDNTVTSDPATLTVVLAAPVFTQEPASVTVNEHATATFHCAATGTNVTYAWTKDGVEIADETAQELSIGDAGLADEAAYRCVARNRDNTVTSDPATMTVVLSAPVFTQEPASVTVNEHATATFHCTATGTNVAYAWTKDGLEIADETAQALSIPDAGLADEAAYRCVARNRDNTATSAPATLTVVLAAPVVTQHPVGLDLVAGETADFECAATGTAISFQWQLDGVDLVDDATTLGATTSQLTLLDVESLDRGIYTCVVSNRDHTRRSDAAELTVLVEIDSCVELQAIELDLGGQYRLVADVDCAGFTGGSGSGFDSIGEVGVEGGAFTGVLDGDGHVVSGLHVVDGQGLFAALAGAQVTRLGLDDIHVESSGLAGAFAGTASSSTISESYATGTLESIDRTGGLVGRLDQSSQMTDVYSHVDVLVLEDWGLLVWEVAGEASLRRAYAAAPSALPGVIAGNYGEGGVQDAFFDCELAGNCAAFGARTTDQLRTQATFTTAGFDFDARWGWPSTGGYPCLRWQEGCIAVFAPVISSDPVDTTVAEGQPVSLTCASSGQLLAYHWQKDGLELVDGANVSGATTASLTLASVGLADEGEYTCVVSNPVGTDTSAAATVAVTLAAPVVTTHPSSTVVDEGESASFSCAASGTGLSFRWQKDGVELAGATESTLAIAGARLEDEGEYRCLVSNRGNPPVYSDAATLAVRLAAPVITQQPSSTSVTEGDDAVLTCAASGTGVTIRWQRNQTDISGATGSTLTLSAVEPADQGSYRCVASNRDRSTQSDEASLTVLLRPPVITAHPASQTVTLGQGFTLSVTATGTGLQHQWRRNGADIAGATSATYGRNPSTLADSGQYVVVVSNSGGSVTSNPATITVQDLGQPRLTVNNPPNVAITEDSVVVTGQVVDSGPLTATIRSSRFADPFGVVLGSDGTFEGEIPLDLGENVLTISVVDEDGNTATTTITVIVQATALPRIAITAPVGGSVVDDAVIDVAGFARSTLSSDQIRMRIGDAFLFPTGSGGHYTWLFRDVPLDLGLNVITVVAETPLGTTTRQVVVTRVQQLPPEQPPTPPTIALEIAQPRVYLTTDVIPVSGTVTAQTCVSSVTVNGFAADLTHAGSVATFDASLTFSAAGSDEVEVRVIATDCNGRTAEARYHAVRDGGAPVIDLGSLALAPAINSVLGSPYRLTATVTDGNLAGISLNDASVGAFPGSAPDSWTVAVDVPLTRAVDAQLTLEAWDYSGNRSSRTVIVRLDSAVAIDILSPADGSTFLVSGSSPQLEVVARIVGLAPGDQVFASFDGSPSLSIPAAGEYASATLTIPTTDGAHQLDVVARSAAGAMLATASSSFTIRDADGIPLEVVRQEPANEASSVEANVPITLHFNRSVDVSRLQVRVHETVHGLIFKDQGIGADFSTQSSVEMQEVHRDHAPVPGGSQNLPGNTTVAFYPSEDYGYGGTVFIEVLYDNVEVYRSRFYVRPLPTLIHGFLADENAVPLANMEVALPELGRTTTTDSDGNWTFGYAQDPSQMLTPGRHRVTFNSQRKAGFGSSERFLHVPGPGLHYQGVTALALLNPGEPFRHIASEQTTPAVLASGDLSLDLSQATLAFADGAPEGDVHVQLLGPTQMGNSAMASAVPDWVFSVQPTGIGVTGPLSVQINLPSRAGLFSYVEGLPDLVVLVGLDPATLYVTPVGIGRVDRAGRLVQNAGPLSLQRLDYLGISTVFDDQVLLQRVVDGQMSIVQLTAAMEASQP